MGITYLKFIKYIGSKLRKRLQNCLKFRSPILSCPFLRLRFWWLHLLIPCYYLLIYYAMEIVVLYFILGIEPCIRNFWGFKLWNLEDTWYSCLLRLTSGVFILVGQLFLLRSYHFLPCLSSSINLIKEKEAKPSCEDINFWIGYLFVQGYIVWKSSHISGLISV